MINLDNQVIIEHRPENQVPKNIGSSFYRGKNCNFNPYFKDREDPQFCKKFILHGHLPVDPPFLRKSDVITTFGSCFAQHITEHLMKLGYRLNKQQNPNIYISNMGEGLVNVYAILQQFLWAFDEISFHEYLWYDRHGNVAEYNEQIKRETRVVFEKTTIFIITLGLSEVWYNKESNDIFWRAIPVDKFDENLHAFKVCSFEETKNAIKRIHETIQRHIPNAKVLFTLSPIPLAATFRNQSCITANYVSKAILRASLDEYMRFCEGYNKSIFYFPSYEIIHELFPNRFIEDGRHLHKEIIEQMMQIFEVYYCETTADPLFAEKSIKSLSEKSRKNWEGV